MMHESRIPIIELYGNLVVPIQVALSDSLVLQLKDDLGHRIQNSTATGLVVDVSGIDVLDSYLSRAIHDIAAIARLMGVRTMMCGLDPMMALALVEMGLPFEAVESALNLETALDTLRSRRERDNPLPANGPPGGRERSDGEVP